jgi:hypothetical protein
MAELQTPVADISAAESSKTPWHLWTVGVLSLLWNAVGAFDYTMSQTHNESYMANFTAEQLEYFYGFPAWVVFFWALAVWGSIAGSVLLLLRNRWAVEAFLVSMVSMFVTFIYNYVLSDGMEIMGGVGSLIFTLVIIVVGVLLYIYSKNMRAKGVIG